MMSAIQVAVRHFPSMVLANCLYDGKPQPISIGQPGWMIEAVEYLSGIQWRFVRSDTDNHDDARVAADIERHAGEPQDEQASAYASQ